MNLTELSQAAHRGAVSADGSTIAGLGCGADGMYPPEHATLARAIEQCNSSPAARAKMLFRFEELASSAEAEARLDAEFFEGLRDGQVMKQQLRREHEQRDEPAPEVTILAPSTTTKH